MSTNAPTTGSSLCAETKRALGLLKDTISQMESEAMTLDELSRCNSHQNPFENASKTYSKQIEEQVQHLRDRWGFKCTDAEISALYVPHPRGQCKTLLVMPPGKVVAGMENLCAKWREEKKFKVWTFADGELNLKVRNDRRHLGMYALLHGGGRDADEELRNRSFEQNQNDGVETLRGVEVLYFEDLNFLKTGEHLDPHTATITGSLDSGGFAVYVGWDGGVSVRRCHVQGAGPNYGGRAAVYL